MEDCIWRAGGVAEDVVEGGCLLIVCDLAEIEAGLGEAGGDFGWRGFGG